MLLSTKDQGLGRRRRSYSHGHVYSMSQAARSSKLSLLSAITIQSTGSNGSSSTVTQDSYNKSRSETSRKRKAPKRRKETPRTQTPPMEAVEEAISEAEGQPGDLDVFAFLVKDEGMQRNAGENDATIKAATEDATNDKHVSDQRLHSDSGISMDDGSIVLGQAILKPLLSTLPEHQLLEQGESSQIRFDWTWPDAPRPKRSMMPAEPPYHYDGIGYPAAGVDHVTPSPQAFCFTPDSRDSPCPSRSTYDRLAPGEASSGSPCPPLRVFTQTCRRLLVNLHQEVSDLESELKQLEAYWSTTNQVGTEPAESSGRRGSWQWGQYPSDLSALRSDIIGRLHLKLENYYHLLLLSQKVDKLKAASAASTDHIETFRARLEKLRELPSAEREALLLNLDDEEDLVTLYAHCEKTEKTVIHDNLGRIVLGVSILMTAVTLQIASDLQIKLLVGLQMVGMIVALCLPVRNK